MAAAGKLFPMQSFIDGSKLLACWDVGSLRTKSGQEPACKQFIKATLIFESSHVSHVFLDLQSAGACEHVPKLKP